MVFVTGAAWLLLAAAGPLLVQAGKTPGQASAGPRRLSIEDVVSVRRVRSVQISPDGTRVAFVVDEPNDEQHSKAPRDTAIWIASSDGRELLRYTPMPGNASSPAWSPDGRTIAFLSTRPETLGSQIYLIDLSSGRERRLTNHPTSISSFSWSPDGNRIAYSSTVPLETGPEKRMEAGYDEIEVGDGPDQQPRSQKLWVIEVGSGATEPVQVGDLHVVSAQWSPDGSKFLLTVSKNAFSDEVQLRSWLATVSSHGGQLSPYCGAQGRLMEASWSPDGSAIAFLGRSEDGPDAYPGALFVCHGEASPAKNLILNSQFTVESYRWMPDGKSVLIIATAGAHRYVALMSIEDGKLEALTHSPSEVAFRTNLSRSRDGKRVACILAASNKPPDVWLLEPGRPMKQLTRLNADLENRTYGAGEEVRWEAKDGLPISGVLLKPVGYQRGVRYPLVVQVHGSQVGDVNEYEATWMNWGQLLAANGYAVLLPNYRGSLTSGAKFARADQGDLGGKDLQDILDGVDAMVRQGIADPDRLGIGGVSYGGFLSAWAVTQSNRFKAAVMGLGISDWIGMAGETPGPESMQALYWIHSPYEDRGLLWSRSPLAFAEQVKTPTLIYGGERDPLVPVPQWREFFRALRHYGVPTKFVLYPREGHSVEEPNHLKDNLKLILDWFDRYVKGAP